MPRYRFRWENLDPTLLAVLCAQRGEAGVAPAQALQRRYGARPKLEFVAENWPAIRDAWLPRSDDLRTAIVGDLRACGLGDGSIDLTETAGQMRYLRSCRNHSTLREVVLDRLIAAGEAPAVAAPGPKRSGVGDGREHEQVAPVDRDAVSSLIPLLPSDVEELTEAVDASLRKMLDTEQVVRDEDGDVPIVFGSANLFVRILDDRPAIRLFVPVLADVPSSMALLDALNDINRDYLYVRACWVDDHVLLTIDVPAAPYVEAHFASMVETLGTLADEIDDALQQRLGGRLFTGTSVHRPHETGGYL